MKTYFIPRHAHAKAIEFFKRQHETNSYPLRVVNGIHGGVIRDEVRKHPVAGLRVYFTVNDGRSSILRFERTK